MEHRKSESEVWLFLLITGIALAGFVIACLAYDRAGTWMKNYPTICLEMHEDENDRSVTSTPCQNQTYHRGWVEEKR